ncbi:hypothetical protein EJ04DRAFT_565697 [Polyplosphaeria fusca]|uniref:Uncharacterized protein n=1 Tax=Polyplosphaeria fusca TaxID=682080 RepID=A0A9P4QXQ5_9PLEO|nr:hypothetical protein EJ04DRAFT_565697 [Polyplosphaeria fusca]
MATNEADAQPVKDVSKEEVQDTADEAAVAASDYSDEEGQKAYVNVDPNAVPSTPKYEVNDVVHMSIIQGGARTKGTFTVERSRYSQSQRSCQYRLIDVHSGSLYNQGEWVRERFLRPS